MVRRRTLGAAPAATAPAPAPAPQPQVYQVPVTVPAAPAPAPQPVQAEVMAPQPAAALPSAPVPSNLPALFTGDLAAIGRFQRMDTLRRVGGVSAPYVGFFSLKSSKAREVMTKLGNIAEGTPFIHVDGEYYNAGGLCFQILQELPFWSTKRQVGLDEWEDDRCWLTPQPFGATIGQQKIQENLLTVMLIIPGVQALPQDLGPCFATLTTLRGPKSRAGRAHLDAVERTLDPAWAREGGNGPIAAAIPDRFRIASYFVVEAKTAKSTGNVYVSADAQSATVNLAQIEALRAWEQDRDAQEHLREVFEAFNTRAQQLTDLANETAANGSKQ